MEALHRVVAERILRIEVSVAAVVVVVAVGGGGARFRLFSSALFAAFFARHVELSSACLSYCLRILN